MFYQITLFELEGNPFAIPYTPDALEALSNLGVSQPIAAGIPRRVEKSFEEVLKGLHPELEIAILHPNGTLYRYIPLTVN